MQIIKQVVICILIGFVFMSCQASDNKYFSRIGDKMETIICKDYTISDMKRTCLNTIEGARELKDKTKNAIEYTEETMSDYRKNVV
ncbi:hypothetical protein [Aminipila luticellarii]|uniref:Lipoprotein n=1 Tax=Aminipila luticellarii TaxID=2507160 RepID=A0A410PV82_9FIRM|nr:hypothetical protein [Aminipila luticellarii]QAT42824.1 hypothetical protein EQM06_06020 [Aminipila luticellarii]